MEEQKVTKLGRLMWKLVEGMAMGVGFAINLLLLYLILMIGMRLFLLGVVG